MSDQNEGIDLYDEYVSVEEPMSDSTGVALFIENIQEVEAKEVVYPEEEQTLESVEIELIIDKSYFKNSGEDDDRDSGDASEIGDEASGDYAQCETNDSEGNDSVDSIVVDNKTLADKESEKFIIKKKMREIFESLR